MKGERNYHVFYMICKSDASIRDPVRATLKRAKSAPLRFECAASALLHGSKLSVCSVCSFHQVNCKNWENYKVCSQLGTVAEVTSWNDNAEFKVGAVEWLAHWKHMAVINRDGVRTHRICTQRS